MKKIFNRIEDVIDENIILLIILSLLVGKDENLKWVRNVILEQTKTGINILLEIQIFVVKAFIKAFISGINNLKR